VLKKLLAFMSTILLVVAMVGCTSRAPVQVSVDEGNLVLAFCESMTISSIDVLQTAEGEAAYLDWKLIASSRDTLEVAVNEVIVLGKSGNLESGDEGFRSDIASRLSVEFDREGVGFSNPVFRVPDEGLEEGAWLRSDGSVVGSPCG
jgi:hypothetical protein